MNKNGLQKSLTQLSTACSFSAGTANIRNAKVASGKEDKHLTKVFSPDKTFYCIADLSNASDDTTVKAVWTAVDVEGEPNTKIDDTKTTTGSGQLQFNLTNDSSWPVGKYKAGRSACKARLLLLAST